MNFILLNINQWLIRRSLLLPLFVVCAFSTLNAQQAIPAKDSLSIIEVTKNLEEYYKDPVYYKNQLPITGRKIDSILKYYPRNRFLMLQKALINDHLASFAFRRIEPDIAFQLLNESINIKTQLKDTLNLPISYRGLGQLYKSQKNYTKSREMYQKAADISRSVQNNYHELMSEIELARYNQGKLLKPFDIKEQSIFIERLKQIAIKANVLQLNRVEANAYFSISSAYNRLKNRELSYKNTLKAKELFELDTDKLGLEKSNAILGQHYRKTNNPSKALIHYKKSIEFLEKLQDSTKLAQRYLGLSNAYVKTENYKGAYEYYLKYKTIDKRLTSLEKVRDLAEVETRMVYEKQKAIDSIRFKAEENLKIEKLKQESQQRTGFLVFGASILLALAVIGYLLYRQRAIKAENQLMLKNERNRELQEKIEEKTQEVSALVSETVEHLNKKEQLTQSLKQLALKKEGITIQSILMELKADKIEDDKSIILKQNIADISTEFISKLKNSYPNLTKNDIEISSFIKLGLSQKEIANLRNTSQEAVKKSRYRLRNKLGLDKTQSLDDFIKFI